MQVLSGRGVAEQQAARLALEAIQQEVAQVRAHRLAVAPPMVALDPLIPLRRLFRLGRRLQLEGRQVGQRPLDRRLPCGAAVKPRPGPRLAARARMPRRSRSSSRRMARWMRLRPLGVLQRRCSQIVCPSSVPAQSRQAAHSLLDAGDLAPSQPLAEEGSGLEAPDQRLQEAPPRPP